jgi:hypothetical protein
MPNHMSFPFVLRHILDSFNEIERLIFENAASRGQNGADEETQRIYKEDITRHLRSEFIDSFHLA